MKHHRRFILSLTAGALLPLVSAHCTQNGWKAAECLAPGDLGITKCVIEESPPVGKVLVIHATRSLNGKVVDISEQITYTAGEKTVQSIVYFDPWAFPFSTPEMCKKGVLVNAPVGGWGNDSLSPSNEPKVPISSYGGNKVEFNFIKPNGDHINLTYVTSIESYASAKKRFSEIPVISSDPTKQVVWTYKGSIPVGK